MDVPRKFDKPLPYKWRDYEASLGRFGLDVQRLTFQLANPDKIFQNQTRANCRGWAWFKHVQTERLRALLAQKSFGHMRTVTWHFGIS